VKRKRVPDIVAGRVNSDGTINGGEGFSVRKIGTGQYTITFDGKFKPYVCTVTPYIAASAFCGVVGYESNTVVVNTFVWNTANTVGDCPFNFVAVGSPQ